MVRVAYDSAQPALARGEPPGPQCVRDVYTRLVNQLMDEPVGGGVAAPGGGVWVDVCLQAMCPVGAAGGLTDRLVAVLLSLGSEGGMGMSRSCLGHVVLSGGLGRWQVCHRRLGGEMDTRSPQPVATKSVPYTCLGNRFLASCTTLLGITPWGHTETCAFAVKASRPPVRQIRQACRGQELGSMHPSAGSVRLPPAVGLLRHRAAG